MKRFLSALTALAVLLLGGCAPGAVAATPTPTPTAAPTPTPTPTPDPAIYEAADLSVADALSDAMALFGKALLLHGAFEGVPGEGYAWQVLLDASLSGLYGENAGLSYQELSASALLQADLAQAYYDQYFDAGGFPALGEDNPFVVGGQIRSVDGFYAFYWSDGAAAYAARPAAVRQNFYGDLEIECDVLKDDAYQGYALLSFHKSDAAYFGYALTSAAWLSQGSVPGSESGRQGELLQLLGEAAHDSGESLTAAPSAEFAYDLLWRAWNAGYVDVAYLLEAEDGEAILQQSLLAVLQSLLLIEALPALPQGYERVTFDEENGLYAFHVERNPEKVPLAEFAATNDPPTAFRADFTLPDGTQVPAQAALRSEESALFGYLAVAFAFAG